MQDGAFDVQAAWKRFSAFQVLGDHMPMTGFRLVLQIAADPAHVDSLLEARAGRSDPLDPDLARATLRAGLAIVRSDTVSFVYAAPEQTVALLRPNSVKGAGRSLEIHDRLVSLVAARLALLVGEEIAVHARIYEFPDLGVARRAFCGVLEAIEEATPLRSAMRLGAQLRGRGEPFHPSMIETLEEQTALLQGGGIDMEALPPWWWRGVAARAAGNGEVHVFDDLPSGDDFAELVEDP
jgi:hypothetical protein